MDKKAKVVIEGENLDILDRQPPAGKDRRRGRGKAEKEAVKANILGILKEQYGIEEDDFLSAELEIVPADKARDCGLDRSMIMAYGQDDRVCAYTSLEAQLAMSGAGAYDLLSAGRQGRDRKRRCDRYAVPFL